MERETQVRERRKVNVIAGNIVAVKYDSIVPDPDQPRRTFDPKGLHELAESLDTNGLLQPITIRPSDDSTAREKRYIIIAGERRWRAAGLLGWETVPSIIRKDLSDHEAAKLQLLENIVRRDLNVMEEAQAINRMLDSGFTPAELGECLGTPPNIVSYKLNLLNLRDDIQALVASGEISSGVAHSLTKLSHESQGRVVNTMAKKDLSVAQIRALCDKMHRQENEVDEVPFFQLLTEDERTELDAYYEPCKRAIGALAQLGEMDQLKVDSLASTIADQVEFWEPQIRNTISGVTRLLRSIEKQTAGQVEEGD